MVSSETWKGSTSGCNLRTVFVCADSDISILVAFPTRYIYVTPYNRALAYILIACYFRVTFNSWSCDLQRGCTFFFVGQKVGPGRCDLGLDTRPPRIRFGSICIDRYQRLDDQHLQTKLRQCRRVCWAIGLEDKLRQCRVLYTWPYICTTRRRTGHD